MHKKPFQAWLGDQLIISGCNQNQLAKRLKLHRSIISNWMVGRHLPEPRILLSIASSLDLSDEEIVLMLQSIINSLQAREAK